MPRARTRFPAAAASPPPRPAPFHNFLMQRSGTKQVIGAIDLAGPVLRFATQTEGGGGFALTG